MGAVNSCCIPRRTFEECRENHASTPKRLTRRNLSATFQWPSNEEEADPSAGLLNINAATEEELMTLPGINRLTAQHIIEYRRQIGGFKKVEDLALVSGVGATRLTQIRGEICVSSKKVSGSHNSSPTGSRQDLSAPPREKRRPNGALALRVNVNTANVFQLMRVKGLGHNLAENVVAYRDKKGPFRSLDDLVKVKGVSASVLSAIRYQLTLEGETVAEVSPSGNSSRPPSQYSSNALTNGGVPGITGTVPTPSSAPPTTVAPPPLNGFNSWHSVENILEYLGPAISQGKRKPVRKFAFRKDGRKVFRVATWNLQNFSAEKASNRDVQDVVCMTVLENGFGIVAVQELADRQALQKICDELNNPTLPHVREWKGRRGEWRCVVSEPAARLPQGREHHGFLYDSSQGVELVSSSLLDRCKSSLAPFDTRPFLASFRVIGHSDLALVSVHLPARAEEQEAGDRGQRGTTGMSDILEAVEEHLAGEKEIIILGDFEQSPDAEDFQDLRRRGYTNCIMPWVWTDIAPDNSSGSQSLDNIWLGRHALKSYTDHTAVVRDGLSSPFIPNGWTLGGVVSNHCPVYTELFADTDVDSVDIARGVDNIVFTVGAGS